MGIFEKLFRGRKSETVPLASFRLGSGAEMRISYKNEGSPGKGKYQSCPNCGFSSGFSAVWTCRECSVTFCTQCLSDDDRCPKCNKRNFIQSGIISTS